MHKLSMVVAVAAVLICSVLAVPVASATDGASDPAATVTVTTADQLQHALDTAVDGDVIYMEPGVYRGNFRINGAAGAAGRTLVGAKGAVIDGGKITGGYGLHLNNADRWTVSGLAIQNVQKGLVADYTEGATIAGLEVSDTGHEGIHLRKFSKDNVVEGNEVHRTGLVVPEYGEGIYVGSAKSNWSALTSGKPDSSNRNQIVDNVIYDTTAEAIDIKEGTWHGAVSGNVIDGTGMSAADAWVNVKGNRWVVEGNHGTDSPAHGFAARTVLTGWGENNVFRGNVAAVNGPGYGFKTWGTTGTVVTDDNTVTGAASGFSDQR